MFVMSGQEGNTSDTVSLFCKTRSQPLDVLPSVRWPGPKRACSIPFRMQGDTWKECLWVTESGAA